MYDIRILREYCYKKSNARNKKNEGFREMKKRKHLPMNALE